MGRHEKKGLDKIVGAKGPKIESIKELRVEKFLLSFIGLSLLLIDSLSADEISKDTRQRVDTDIVNIINLAQAYSGQVRTDIIANAQEIQRLLEGGDKQTPVAQVMSDQRFNQMIVVLKSLTSFQAQVELIKKSTQSSRMTTLQLKGVIACIPEVRNKKEGLRLLFPLVVDFENVDQLFDVYAVSEPPQDPPKTYQNNEVEAIVSRIKAAWPYSGQKIIIQNLPEKPLFTVLQVKMIISVIDFDKDKKEVLSLLLPGVIDPENVDSLFDIFWTPSDKQFLNGLVKKKTP
jgi:Domain of unknown function (DUF4476)